MHAMAVGAVDAVRQSGHRSSPAGKAPIVLSRNGDDGVRRYLGNPPGAQSRDPGNGRSLEKEF